MKKTHHILCQSSAVLREYHTSHPSSMASKKLQLSLIQLNVGLDKAANVTRAVNLIKKAAAAGSKLIALPECFNSPYGTQHFPVYAEEVPAGETCKALSAAARENQVFLVGGSIPERDGNKLFNTSTVWNPSGELIAKHRKTHLFDISVPGMTFKESETLSPGSRLTTFVMDDVKVGLGICYDIRFEEMARLYRSQNCDMILYPGAFNMKTGPMHWELLLRARAVDNQLFCAGIAPARDLSAGYHSFGHTMLVSPWGNILASAKFDEQVISSEIDFEEVVNMRAQIPTSYQRRHDLYETVDKTKI